MKAGTYFRIKAYRDYIFQVIEKEDKTCNGCCAAGKHLLCRKLPFCTDDIGFKRLNTYERRQVKKEKQIIEFFEK